MNRKQWFDDFQKNVSEMIARSPFEDVRKKGQSMMGQVFAGMGLVTHEEFDIDTELLARANARALQLAQRLDELERRVTELEKPAVPKTPV